MRMHVKVNDYFDNWFKGFKDEPTHDIICNGTTSKPLNLIIVLVFYIEKIFI